VGKLPVTAGDSDGRRNTCLKFICGSLESKSFPWTLIQAQRDLVELQLSDSVLKQLGVVERIRIRVIAYRDYLARTYAFPCMICT